MVTSHFKVLALSKTCHVQAHRALTKAGVMAKANQHQAGSPRRRPWRTTRPMARTHSNRELIWIHQVGRDKACTEQSAGVAA